MTRILIVETLICRLHEKMKCQMLLTVFTGARYFENIISNCCNKCLQIFTLFLKSEFKTYLMIKTNFSHYDGDIEISIWVRSREYALAIF